MACSVSVMWRSVDRLHSLMGRFSVLKYLALEPHSPPTRAPDDIHTQCYSRALATENFISNENRAIKKSDDSGRRSH